MVEPRARMTEVSKWHQEHINPLLFHHVHHRDQRDVMRRLLPINVRNFIFMHMLHLYNFYLK